MQKSNTDSSFTLNISSTTLQNVRIASNRHGPRDAYFAETICYDILSQPSSFMSHELTQDFYVCNFQPNQHRQFLFTGSLDLTIVHKRILYRSLHCKNHKDMTFHTVSTSDYTNSWAINIIATHRSSWPTVYVPPKEMVWSRPGRINHTIPHHLLNHHRLSMLHSTSAHSLPPLTRWPPQPRIYKQEWSIDFLNSKPPS